MPQTLPSLRATLAALLLGGLAAASCSRDATSPQARLVLGAASRLTSLRDDSAVASADSALVAVGGADAATAHWVVTHGQAAWLTLTGSGGTGIGRLRWTRNPAGLFPGTYVDTITVTLQTADATSARFVDSLVIRSAPAQYISVRRAWLPGERDSLAAYVVRNNAWGDYSATAAQAVAAWDSTTDVILNPAWHPSATPPVGPLRAPQFQTGWRSMGVEIYLIFDSIPNNTATKDSLHWVSTRWWNPADSTWQGFIVCAGCPSSFSAFRTIKTPDFDASGGHTGVAAGEARLASLTYWEGNNGGYRVSSNGGYGALQQITSGPYLGGDVQFGTMAGFIKNATMPRLLGTDTPTTEKFSYDYSLAPINIERIFCWFTGTTPPSPYHQCTGQAAAALVAVARAGKLDARAAAGLLDPFLPAPPRRLRRARRTRGVHRASAIPSWGRHHD